MKKRWQKFAALCVVLLAAYAAVDVLSDIYLQNTKYDIKAKSFHHKYYQHKMDGNITEYLVSFKLKDGTHCDGFFFVKDVSGTNSPRLVRKHFQCYTNYFILNARRPDFRDSMEIGKDYQREYNERIPGMPPTPGIP